MLQGVTEYRYMSYTIAEMAKTLAVNNERWSIDLLSENVCEKRGVSTKIIPMVHLGV